MDLLCSGNRRSPARSERGLRVQLCKQMLGASGKKDWTGVERWAWLEGQTPVLAWCAIVSCSITRGAELPQASGAEAELCGTDRTPHRLSHPALPCLSILIWPPPPENVVRISYESALREHRP